LRVPYAILNMRLIVWLSAFLVSMSQTACTRPLPFRLLARRKPVRYRPSPSA